LLARLRVKRGRGRDPCNKPAAHGSTTKSEFILEIYSGFVRWQIDPGELTLEYGNQPAFREANDH
jgi:hypothetical protein